MANKKLYQSNNLLLKVKHSCSQGPDYLKIFNKEFKKKFYTHHRCN